MRIRLLKMRKMSDKMRQDGGKMRKMKDVSSVLGPPGRYEGVRPANNGASRCPGEVPPLGRDIPTPPQPQNPYSDRFASKMRFSLGPSLNFLGSPSRFTMYF